MLALLIAVVGSLVLAFTAGGRRTASAFTFVADEIVVIAVGVLLAANLLAMAPALAASRARLGRLLATR